MIGGVVFLVGISGLIAFAVVLFVEAKRGERLFAGVRKQGDRFFALTYRTLVFGEIPQVYRTAFIARIRNVFHSLVNVAIKGLRAVERPLARMSQRMHYTQQGKSQTGGTPSPFLKEISVDGKKDGKNAESSV